MLTPLNYTRLTLAADYAAGSGTATVADASGLGSPSPGAAVILTAFRASAPTVPLFNARVEAVAGNVLTLAAITWGADTSLEDGDLLVATACAELFAELQALVAANAAAIVVLDAALGSKADDSAVVHKAGDETIAGTKTFTSTIDGNAATSSLAAVATALANTLGIAGGGTGATTAAGARTNLGLVIGTDVLAPNGSGADLTGLNASALGSGTVATARLGSGTADGTTFLRGDQTWAAPPPTSPAGSDRDIQVNNAGAFGVAANFTLTTSGTLNLPGGDGTTTNPAIQFNNTTSVNPIIRWVSTTGLQGLRFYSNNTEICRLQDNGAAMFTTFGTLGGLNFGNFFMQRGSGPRVDLGAAGSYAIDLTTNNAAHTGTVRAKAGLAGVSVLTTEGIASQAGYHWILKGQSSTTAGQNMAAVDGVWADSTHASRKGRMVLYACDSTGTDREGLRVESDGTAARLGFYGATAAAKPTVTGSRGGNAALASLLAQLASLGLITDSTTA